MIQRRPKRVLGLLACWCATSGSFAQQPPSPDLAVTLNEGIYHYLQGQVDEDSYGVAVQRFTSVIESEPGNATALMFRALSYGRLGLVAREKKLGFALTPSLLEEVLDIRANPGQLDELHQEIAEAEALLADEAATAGERDIASSQLLHHRALLYYLEQEKEKPDTELQANRRYAMNQYYEMARREREQYLAMIDDLRSLVRTVDHPEAVIRLLEVVANAKVARADEEEARGLVRGEVKPGEAGGTVEALRAAANERLDQASRLLEALLGESLDEHAAVRAKFFLAVIRYRQATPLRAEEEAPGLDARERKLLGQSEKIMAELADDETTDPAWRSYAALYLGIITPFRAAEESDEAARNAILDEADRRLNRASELDAEEVDMLTTIPDLVWRQRKVIAQLRRAVPAPPPRNDLSLSFHAGARYDTNVPLLGERTDLPRDISRQGDFGFTLGWAADYTWDITERLTLGLQGRTSQLWNVDVHEFDQQTYGGSVALQYGLFPQSGDVGPAYLALQYDFDYTLLGRSAFLESHAVTPSVRLYWADRLAQTDLFLAYQLREYSEPLYDKRFNRDGMYGTVGVLQRFKALDMAALYEGWNFEPWGWPSDDSLSQDHPDYPQRYLTPYAAVSYSWDATEGDEFDRKAGTLLLGVALPLPRGFEFDASAVLEWEDYPKNSLTDYHRRRRRDFVQEYGFTLSRTFVLREGESRNRYTPAFDRLLMTVQAHVIWTMDDSNVVDRLGQAIFDYDRAVYGLSVAFTFN